MTAVCNMIDSFFLVFVSQVFCLRIPETFCRGALSTFTARIVNFALLLDLCEIVYGIAVLGIFRTILQCYIFGFLHRFVTNGISWDWYGKLRFEILKMQIFSGILEYNFIPMQVEQTYCYVTYAKY